MDQLNELLKPVWGLQKEILLIWSHITEEERRAVSARIDKLFENGLPFELKHDREIYIHLFTTLAQVDIMACQIPMKFEVKLSASDFQQRLRAQLLDEIFHVLLSIKIVYLLCGPYSYPPVYANKNFANLCDFISREETPEMAVVLLNLIGEGIAEELVKSFDRCGFAPKVFDLILMDERRHVSDADLYLAIGLPDKNQVKKKIAQVEKYLMALLFEYNVTMSLYKALGIEGVYHYMRGVDRTYTEQLNKLGLRPGRQWQASMQVLNHLMVHNQQNNAPALPIEMTPLRQLSMTQWAAPSDPTMVGQFNIDISCLDFFNKKYPSQTLTTLILQTISQLLENYPEYQMYLRDNQIYQRQIALVGLVVKLPGCGDQLGIISFQDCHKLTVQELSIKIQQTVMRMVYCYKKREELEKKYPQLILISKNMLDSMSDPVYSPIRPEIPGVCLSNIGAAGYAQGVSPLLANEASKITLFEVQRTPVWCENSQSFKPQDLLPVSVSVDHRIYGGNLPIPKIMAKTFQEVFQRMQPFETISSHVTATDVLISQKIDYFLAENLELGYMTLTILQTMWPDYIAIDELFKI